MISEQEMEEVPELLDSDGKVSKAFAFHLDKIVNQAVLAIKQQSIIDRCLPELEMYVNHIKNATIYHAEGLADLQSLLSDIKELRC